MNQETNESLTGRFPTKNIAGVEVRDLPEAPKSFWKILGPGVIAAGVGLASGEFVLWPYISAQVGLVLLWGAFLGIATQWFLNMEIERYTLATGETVLTGFSRLGKHWGLLFVVMTFFANLWPGWVTSSATCLSYIVGGSPPLMACAMLVIIGAALTFAPVVYIVLERFTFLKIFAVALFIGGSLIWIISKEAWQNLPSAVTHFGQVPPSIPFALFLGALAFAGAGGGQNLCQSNWIRDKGFGMGLYVPRLVSPITGEEEAKPSTGFIFNPTPENMERWRGWWRITNWEQALTFGAISFITIAATSMIAYSTAYGQPRLPQDVNFLKIQGTVMQAKAGNWFGILFWAVGAFSLFTTSLGIVDFTSRLAADVLKTVYLQKKDISENRLYFLSVWGLVTIGILVILSGLSQPLVLLVISAVVGGLMMFLYSMLLLALNGRVLPPAIRPGIGRVLALIWSVGLFGVLCAISLVQQIEKLRK